MASLPLLTSTTATRNQISFPQPPKFSSFTNLAQYSTASKLVCQATNITANKDPQINNPSLDRRNMLATFSWVATALTTVVPPDSMAAEFPKPIDSVVRTTVTRPRKSRSKADKAGKEEVLVVDIQVLHAKARMLAFDAYINYNGELPQDLTQRFDKKEYAGSFSALRHSAHHKGNMDTTVRFSLNRIIEDLGVDDDNQLEVTLVPQAGPNSIIIKDVRIDYIKN